MCYLFSLPFAETTEANFNSTGLLCGSGVFTYCSTAFPSLFLPFPSGKRKKGTEVTFSLPSLRKGREKDPFFRKPVWKDRPSVEESVLREGTGPSDRFLREKPVLPERSIARRLSEYQRLPRLSGKGRGLKRNKIKKKI